MNNREIGEPIDTYVARRHKEHYTNLITEAVNHANDVIKHGREKHGMSIELAIRPEGLIDAFIDRPKGVA